MISYASMRVLIAALLLLAAPTKEPKDAPLKKVDRTMAVGAPVLDEKTQEGIYVWLEDGWFNVAAVSRARSKRSMSVAFRATKKIEKTEGDFTKRDQSGGINLSASVGEVAVKGRFKTEGEVTVKTTHPLYIGPLSKKAASTVSIGRY